MHYKRSELNLPKERLSWSAVSLWKSNKDAFRSKYYEGIEQPTSEEMIFGKKIARYLEKNDPSLAHVPRYSVPEFRIEVEIQGVPMLGFLDSFDPVQAKFKEMKTGRVHWDRVRVAKHGQLPLYMSLIRAKCGFYHPYTELVWLETARKKSVEVFGGMELVGDRGEIYLTGKVETFTRRIAKWELRLIEKDVRKVAEEVSEDYAGWLKSNI